MTEKFFTKPVLVVIGMILLLTTSCAKVSSDGDGASTQGVVGTLSENGGIQIGAISLSSENGNTVIRTNSPLTHQSRAY